jgi:hypothetical protein
MRGRSGVCISHSVDRRKPEVLGARDLAPQFKRHHTIKRPCGLLRCRTLVAEKRLATVHKRLKAWQNVAWWAP